MKENSTVCHAIIIFVLLFNVINYASPTWAAPPKSSSPSKITKEHITKLCSKSLNPTLCYDLLKDAVGQPLTNTTTLSMAAIPLNMADSHARGARQMLESLYKGATDPKSEVKPKYKTCMAKYEDAIKFLDGGKRNLQEGRTKAVSSYAIGAANRVHSCVNEFYRKPNLEPEALKNANKKVKDLCGVVVVLCYGG